jgi:hypothetical protein
MTFDPKARALGMSYTGPVVITAAAVLKPEQVMVHATAAGAYNLDLPPVADCVGRIFSITRMTAGSGTITVRGLLTDGAQVAYSVGLSHDKNRLLCMSDGLNWHTLSSVIGD